MSIQQYTQHSINQIIFSFFSSFCYTAAVAVWFVLYYPVINDEHVQLLTFLSKRSITCQWFWWGNCSILDRSNGEWHVEKFVIPVIVSVRRTINYCLASLECGSPAPAPISIARMPAMHVGCICQEHVLVLVQLFFSPFFIHFTSNNNVSEPTSCK